MRYYLLGFISLLLSCLNSWPAYVPAGGTNRLYFNYTSDIDANFIEVAADKVLNETRVSSGKVGAIKPVYPLLLSASNTALHLFINTNGNIGILTNNPQVPLHVHGSIRSISNINAGYSITVTPPVGYQGITMDVQHTNGVSVLLISNGVLYINGSTNFGGVSTGGATNFPYLWIGTNQFFRTALATNVSGTINVVFTNAAIQYLKAMGALTFSGEPPPTFTNESSCVNFLIDANGTNRDLSFDSDWKFLGVKPTLLYSNNYGMLACLSYSNQPNTVFAAYNSTDSTNVSGGGSNYYYYPTNFVTNIYSGTNFFFQTGIWTNGVFISAKTNINFVNGSNIVVAGVSNADDVTITISAPAITGTNLNTGVPIYLTNVGSELRFKTIKSTTTGLTLSDNTNWIDFIVNTNYISTADTLPTNGQVATFNTGGAVTWENPATNGFASTNYVNTATNNFVGAEITNGLASIEYAQDLLSSVGSHFYFYGSLPTNITDIVPTNTFWAYTEPSTNVAYTNAVQVASNNHYFAGYISTNKYYTVQAGAATVESWIFKDAAGTVSYLAEFYLWDGTNLVEIGSSPGQTVNNTLTRHTFSINVGTTNCDVPVNFVIRYKSSSYGAPTPTVRIVTEGVYDPHMSFAVPAGGLATTNYVNASTNGLASIQYVNAATNPVINTSMLHGPILLGTVSDGQVLKWENDHLAWTNAADETGIAAAGGDSGQIQYNNGGVLGGITHFVWSGVSTQLVATNLTVRGLTNDGWLTANVTNATNIADAKANAAYEAATNYARGITNNSMVVNGNLTIDTNLISASGIVNIHGTLRATNLWAPGIASAILYNSNGLVAGHPSFAIDAASNMMVAAGRVIFDDLSESELLSLTSQKIVTNSGILATNAWMLTNDNLKNWCLVPTNALDGATNVLDIYLDDRTNELTIVGDGTLNNPYNVGGSNAWHARERFDWRMQQLLPTNDAANMYINIRLVPGTYYTRGITPGYTRTNQWYPKSAMRILGSGMENTILKLWINTNDVIDNQYHYAISCGGQVRTNFSIEDLTIDCDASNNIARTSATNISCGAVHLSGEQLAIRRIHAINWGNNSGDATNSATGAPLEIGILSVETFVLTINCGTETSQAWHIIENCIVDRPMYYTRENNAIPICLSGGGAGKKTQHAYILNNYIDGSWPILGYHADTNWITAIQAMQGKNIVIQGNHVANCKVGVYMDTGILEDVLITLNQFRSVASGVYYALNADANNYINTSRIINNRFEINNLANSAGAYGIDLYGTGLIVSNLIISQNYFCKDNYALGSVGPYAVRIYSGADKVQITDNTLLNYVVPSRQYPLFVSNVVSLVARDNLNGSTNIPVYVMEYQKQVGGASVTHVDGNIEMDAATFTNSLAVNKGMFIGNLANVTSGEKWIAMHTDSYLTNLDKLFLDSSNLLHFKEAGGTTLGVSNIATGKYLKRVGNGIEGADVVGADSYYPGIITNALATNTATGLVPLTVASMFSSTSPTFLVTNQTTGTTNLVVGSNGVVYIMEEGTTLLQVSNIADGKFLKRIGNSIAGADPAASSYYPGVITNALATNTTTALVPLAVQAIFETTTNIFEILNTNGSVLDVVKSNGFVGIWTNVPSEALVVHGNAIIQSNITVNETIFTPRSATPNLPLPGALAFDSNAWSATVGALAYNDGVQTNFVVSTRYNDIPDIYQVPMWNTNGYAEWDGYPISQLADPLTARIISMRSNHFELQWDQTNKYLSAPSGFELFFDTDFDVGNYPQIWFRADKSTYDAGPLLRLEVVLGTGDPDLVPLVVQGIGTYDIKATNSILTHKTLTTLGLDHINDFLYITADGAITNYPAGAILSNAIFKNGVVTNSPILGSYVSNATVTGGWVSNSVITNTPILGGYLSNCTDFALTTSVYRTVWIDAGAMRTNSASSGVPSSGTLETPASSIPYDTWDFDGGTAESNLFCKLTLPQEWSTNGLKIRLHCSTVNGTNLATAWGIRAAAMRQISALTNTALFGTYVQLLATNMSGGQLSIATNATALTVGNSPEPGDLVVFEIRREPSEAWDSMSLYDARLIGIEVQYQINRYTGASY